MKAKQGEEFYSASLMVKGHVVQDLNDTILFDEFSKLGEVKDVWMIRDKDNPKKMRDFAFVEFYHSEDVDRIIADT